MKDLSFQQIIDETNGLLNKNGLKNALSISIECQLRDTDAFKDYFSLAIYQREKNATGGTIFHYLHAESMASMKFKLTESIKEKNKL